MIEHEIRISAATFQRLQQHAVPFVDTTPEAVINRALDALEGTRPSVASRTSAPAPTMERRIDPRALPRLTHTKVLSAEIDGKFIERPNWNHLLDEILLIAAKRFRSFDELRSHCPANLVQGKKETDGFAYLQKIDLSVQRQDSNAACRTIVTLAERLGIALEISFIWRPKMDALYPGERGLIKLTGSQTL
ncbi:hypothetical protein Plav_1615 [Parvibaculum lavamentivorans DS-1]|uniref:Uncharacterized protein n=1 Tax=Parvibaculum lavamentivorans (strain DS-1 / DSM 13023 / NCIMB 13966) TaxID=402881 RepID=A7HTK1_PARL1|nr:hypothetical protein [Parvibaculum lavamentivorans]ABS63234.1 hypothetical protein Plav_1615 [Parvibaculum lavamentivorans DS-1]